MISIRGGYLVQENGAGYLAVRLSDIAAVRFLSEGIEQRGEILTEAKAIIYTEPTCQYQWLLRGPDASSLPEVWNAYLNNIEDTLTPKGEE